MGIVAGNEEAVRHGAVIVGKAHSESLPHTVEGIRKEGRSSALLCLAAHLLIVEQTVNRHCGVVLFGGNEGFQRAESALQIVKARRGDKSVPLYALLRVVNNDVGGENVLLADACRRRKAGAQTAFSVGIKRKHIHRRVVAHIVVGFAVHVNSNVRNDGAGLLKVNKPHGNALFRLYHNSACDGKRAVKPCGAKHSAVLFGGKAHIVLIRKLRVLLDFERRAVAVRSGHHKSGKIPLRHLERNYGGTVAGYIIAFAVLKIPFAAFAKGQKARFLKRFSGVFHRVERSGAVLYKIKKLFVHFEYSLLKRFI